MSRHTFHGTYQNEAVTVVIGWDPPLRGFFMNIDNGRHDENGMPLYTSLADAQTAFGHTQSLDHYLQVLKTFGIELPEEMVAALEQDRVNNAGNT